MDEHYIGEHYQDGGEVGAPQKTVKAYKLFRTNSKKPGQLFPLFVDANTPVPIGKWVAAKAGDPGKDSTKVKSKLGDLAYRPGWHAGDLPIATHIGGKSSPDLKAPDYRPDNHVWAEIEMPDDIDWQSIANSRMEYTKKGEPKLATAHITDQVPFGGHYRYKTNPNMTGNWMIGGSMKVNRVLSDDEVSAINDANGVADLPRLGKSGGGEVERFHGTDVHDLQKFDPARSRTAKYHYLADEPETAQSYGKHVYKVKLKPKNMISFHPENIGAKQMKVIHELSERLGEDPDHLLHAITSADGSFYGLRGSLQDRVMDELKDMGHDAVRFPDVAPGGGWDMSTVVLDNNIVHSIDKDGADIHKSDGGDVDGITAYHGSPHDFEQFDTSKIGTGEGAQAYGHGLYFAEHEPVAKGYRDKLAKPELNNPIANAWDLVNNLRQDPHEIAKIFEEMPQRNEMAEGTLHSLKTGSYKDYKPKGHMYEVHINAHPHHFLDWDKPLSEQSEHVLNAFQKMYGDKLPIKMTGQDLHDRMNFDLGGADWPVGANFNQRQQFVAEASKRVAKKLHENGIKGIKYLDAGSRGDKEKPTHNYVVFDHNDVHIKRKYERGGRVGFDIGGAVPQTPTLAGVQSFFDQANLVNQQKEAEQSQAAYQQAVQAQQQKEAADAAAKAAVDAKAKEGFGSAVEAGGGGGGEGGGGGGIGGGLGSDFGGAIGGRDSNNADATGAVGSSYGHGGRVDFNTGGPVNVSKAEDTAGNFKKEHEKIHGIPVAIEVKKGHERVKYKPDGKVKFKAKQYADYGAILGTKDADGMNTDVMVGPHKDSDKAYIIDQMKHHDPDKFDEHKVMLGFNKRKKAVKAYAKTYKRVGGKVMIGDVVKTDIKGLKKWLAKGNLNKPASKDALIKSALEVVSKKT